MALSQELPHSFSEAIQLARSILARNLELVRKGVIETEAEQIVLAAYESTQQLKVSRMELHMRLQDRLPESAGQQVILWASARAEGKLLQHLLGFQRFLDHDYQVSPAALIPRPETELLVFEALQHLKKSSSPAQGLEIGLGSGVISIELLLAFPELRMCASELMPEAIALAEKNVEKLLGTQSSRLEILRPSDPHQVMEVFAPASAVDFVISNPPYLRKKDEVEDDVLMQEPWTALFAPENDPLYFYREIALKASRYLRPQGVVFLEMAHERARSIQQLFDEKFWNTRVIADLNHCERILVAELRENQNG